MKLTPILFAGFLVAGCDDAYASSYDAYGAYGASESVATPVAAHGHLTADNGMSLYTFDNDTAGTSNCYGDCAVSWPPYEVATGAQAPGEGFSTVERRDGTLQWAKNGAPLYFWVGDTEPGDVNGDGVGGVWHLAQ